MLQLMRTGLMLRELVSDLIEAIGTGAYPGEEPAAVVIEMLCGTIGTSLESVDPRDVRLATEMIGRAGARTLEHLRIASELSRRIHPGGGGSGRTYG